MFSRTNAYLSFLLIFLIVVFGIPCFAQTAQNPARLDVDLSDAPRHIFHAKLTLPVSAGALTLVYPKWIPGEHSPTGPIGDLVGLKISGGGREIPWRRYDVDMFAFHVDVPKGVNSLELSYDYVSPAENDRMREDAASRGCDGLVVLGTNNVTVVTGGTNYVSSTTLKGYRATCIV